MHRIDCCTLRRTNNWSTRDFQTNASCAPDKCAYNVIIQGFLQHKDPSMARRLVEEMVNRGFSADAATRALLNDLPTNDIPALKTLIGFCEDHWGVKSELMFYREIGWPYFIMGISASGQQRPMMEARVNPIHVLSRENHINSANANNM